MEIAVLRLVHIVAGVFWAGGAMVVGWFVNPVVTTGVSPGAEVVGGMMQRRLLTWMTAASWLVVITGLRLYMLFFSPAWLRTPQGIGLTLGSFLALGAFVIGLAVSRPAAAKIAALSADIRAAGRLSDQQNAEMTALRIRLGRAARLVAWHLLIAVILMAASRLLAGL